MRWATGQSCKENWHYKNVFGQVETCNEEIALQLIGRSFFSKVIFQLLFEVHSLV